MFVSKKLQLNGLKKTALLGCFECYNKQTTGVWIGARNPSSNNRFPQAVCLAKQKLANVHTNVPAWIIQSNPCRRSYSHCRSRCRRREPLRVTQLSPLWLCTWSSRRFIQRERQEREQREKEMKTRGHKRKRRWVNDSVLISLGRRCWRSCLLWSWERSMRGWVGRLNEGGQRGSIRTRQGCENCTEVSLQ